MTQLLIIRHGQASFGTADYDRLSPTGERQARLVGQHLAAAGQQFDVMFAGEMLRQTETARLAAEAWAEPPALQIDAAFNEYDPDALFRAYLPRVLQDNADLSGRQDELFSDSRLFQKVFERVTRHWIDDTPHDGGACERWPDFTARVEAGLTRLHDDYPPDSRIALFTSGGPTAVAIAAAVEASARKTIEMNWSIHNAAISELRATRGGWRLTGFNDISALRAAGDPALITMR